MRDTSRGSFGVGSCSMPGEMMPPSFHAIFLSRGSSKRKFRTRTERTISRECEFVELSTHNIVWADREDRLISNSANLKPLPVFIYSENKYDVKKKGMTNMHDRFPAKNVTL